MEPTNDELWENLQQRLVDVQTRKSLIPRIQEGRKEAIIRSLQRARLRNKPLSDRHKKTEKAYQKARNHWQELLSQYQALVKTEHIHLQNAVANVEFEIQQKPVFDLDLEDYKSALEASIQGLEHEKKAVLKPLEPGKPYWH